MDKETSNIIANIAEKFGIKSLPEEKQAEIIGQLTETLLKKIMVDVLEKLSPEEREEFSALQDAGNPEAIDVFLRSKIENYEQFVADSAESFTSEIQGMMQDIKGNLE